MFSARQIDPNRQTPDQLDRRAAELDSLAARQDMIGNSFSSREMRWDARNLRSMATQMRAIRGDSA